MTAEARSVLPTNDWFKPSRVEVERLPTPEGLREEVLVVRWEGRARPITAGPGLLDAFCSLAEADPNSIVRFAKQWGVLELCEHGYCHRHRLDLDAPPEPGDCKDADSALRWLEYRPIPEPCCRWRLEDWYAGADRHGRTAAGEFDATPTVEPIERWRYWARRAAAIREAIACVRHRRRVPRRVMLVALGFGTDSEERLPKVGDRGHVEAAVNAWLEAGGGASFRLTWGGVVIGAEGLFSAIGMQLAGRMAGGDFTSQAANVALETYRCDGCGAPHTRARRPRAGEFIYCDPCRERGVAAKDRQQRRRERLAALRQEGADLPQKYPNADGSREKPGESGEQKTA